MEEAATIARSLVIYLEPRAGLLTQHWVTPSDESSTSPHLRLLDLSEKKKKRVGEDVPKHLNIPASFVLFCFFQEQKLIFFPSTIDSMEQIQACDLCGKHFNMLSHVTGLDFIVLIIPNKKLQGVPFLVDRSYAFETRNLPKASKQTNKQFLRQLMSGTPTLITADAKF